MIVYVNRQKLIAVSTFSVAKETKPLRRRIETSQTWLLCGLHFRRFRIGEVAGSRRRRIFAHFEQSAFVFPKWMKRPHRWN